MIFSDLAEIKTVLEIDNCDASENKKLLFFAEWTTRWIEEILDRDFSFKTRTEYYDGTNTQKLLLRHRPVYPNPTNPNYAPISVVYDSAGYWGSAPGAFNVTTNSATATALVYGTDYALRIDRNDGGSTSAILYRINEYWLKPIMRQTGLLAPFMADDTGSYQVVYSAGYFTDNLPATLRMAANTIIAKLRHYFPVGMEIGGESYEERALSYVTQAKNYIITPAVRSMVLQHKNWKW